MTNCDVFTQRCGERMSDFSEQEIEYTRYARSRSATPVGILVTLIWIVVVLLGFAYTDATHYLPKIIALGFG